MNLKIVPKGRRKYIRYKTFDDVNVLIRSESDQVLGFLIDISRGGVLFDYIPTGETFKKNIMIDIMSDDKNFCIYNIPSKIIFDIELDSKSYTAVIMRQIGAQFEELTLKQQSDLVYFINDHLGVLPQESITLFNPSLKKRGYMAKLGSIQSDVGTMYSDDIFLSRLKLLIIAAKAYLEDFPLGTYRKKAIEKNSKEILKELAQGVNSENSLRRINQSLDKIHSDYLLYERIILLAIMVQAIAKDYSIGHNRKQVVENNVNFVCDKMRLEDVSIDSEFLKVA